MSFMFSGSCVGRLQLDARAGQIQEVQEARAPHQIAFFPLLAFALLSQSSYTEGGFWDTTLEVLSFVLLSVSEFGRVWVSAYISGRKTVELVTDGPYSITRNPLYFFTFIAYIGSG